MSPLVVIGERALKPAVWDVWPVPPLAIATVPVTFRAVPEQFPVTFPVTLPVTLPVTFPVTLPVTFPVIFPEKVPVTVPVKVGLLTGARAIQPPEYM
jgi:hypothetical protein